MLLLLLVWFQHKTEQSPWAQPCLLNQWHQANLRDPVQEEEMLLVNTLQVKRIKINQQSVNKQAVQLSLWFPLIQVNPHPPESQIPQRIQKSIKLVHFS